MPTISAKPVQRARKTWTCDGLRHACWGWIRPGESYVRLYGSAHEGDPPWVLRLCLPCALDSTCSKTRDAALHLPDGFALATGAGA